MKQKKRILRAVMLVLLCGVCANALITENWLISPPNSQSKVPLISYGARFFGKKIAVDFAFVNNKDIAQSIFIGVPYIDFVVKF
jgi:hypothetical protein